MHIIYNFTPVDRARVSQDKLMSWLAKISEVSGEISVRWARGGSRGGRRGLEPRSDFKDFKDP